MEDLLEGDLFVYVGQDGDTFYVVFEFSRCGCRALIDVVVEFGLYLRESYEDLWERGCERGHKCSVLCCLRL